MNLLILYIKNQNEHVFFPQLAFYYVSFFFEIDWLLEDTNNWLDDDDIRLTIVKRFSSEPKAVLGWALCIASYLLSNIDHYGILTFVFHFIRVTRNFLLYKTMAEFWEIISIVIDHDTTLIPLKGWVETLRAVTLSEVSAKQTNFSTTQRAALCCLALVTVGKIQDQSINANTAVILPSHGVRRYNINYSTIKEKIPIYGDYFDRMFTEFAKVTMFASIETHYERIKSGKSRPSIAAWISLQHKESLPQIEIDTVTPFLNRFFTDAPWVGNIRTSVVPYLYEVTEPEPLFVAGTYDIEGTKIIRKWELFWHIMKITKCFNVTITDMCNGGYFYITHPFTKVSINTTSNWYETFFYIYQIGRYLIGAPSVVETSDVLMGEDGSPALFAGCLKRSRTPFNASDCVKAITANSGAFHLSVLKIIKKNFEIEENSNLLLDAGNCAHLGTNTWLEKIKYVEKISK